MFLFFGWADDDNDFVVLFLLRRRMFLLLQVCIRWVRTAVGMMTTVRSRVLWKRRQHAGSSAPKREQAVSSEANEKEPERALNPTA